MRELISDAKSTDTWSVATTVSGKTSQTTFETEVLVLFWVETVIATFTGTYLVGTCYYNNMLFSSL